MKPHAQLPVDALRTRLNALGAALMAATAALLAACSPTPIAPPKPLPQAKPQPGNVAPQTSNADNPRAYRKDAAGHLYQLNLARIYPGMLPPMLYAIGTLQVEIDGEGRVRRLHWLRAPTHAPEVIAEIERTVRAAAPFPRPVRMGKVVYTDTWLWDESGRFQLDTLTEGQR